MARQTLLSFLGAGKPKKGDKAQERETKEKENASKKMDSLHVVDVEEDIFGDIPDRDSSGADCEEQDWNGAGMDRKKQDRDSGRANRKEQNRDTDRRNRVENGQPDDISDGEYEDIFDHRSDQKENGLFGSITDREKEEDFFQDLIEPEYEVEKAKNIYFEIVLDKTISMSKVYKPIYKKLEKMIGNMDRAVKNYQKKGQVGLKWGLTLITEEEPETVLFKDSYFTASADRIKLALKEFQFEGGSATGYENINGALTAAIRTLSQESRGEGRCGLILLTDSLPEEDDAEPDFEYLEDVEHTELCFAHCFVYNCEAYTPYFNMVDGEGETDVKGIHYLEIRDLDAFLNREADHLTEKLVKKLLHQTSISG